MSLPLSRNEHDDDFVFDLEGPANRENWEREKFPTPAEWKPPIGPGGQLFCPHCDPPTLEVDEWVDDITGNLMHGYTCVVCSRRYVLTQYLPKGE